MLDLKKANEIVRKAKRETEIYRTKLVPYAKKIPMITTGTPTKKRTSFGTKPCIPIKQYQYCIQTKNQIIKYPCSPVLPRAFFGRGPYSFLRK